MMAIVTPKHSQAPIGCPICQGPCVHVNPANLGISLAQVGGIKGIQSDGHLRAKMVERPQCGAKPGMGCRTKSGKMLEPDHRRVLAMPYGSIARDYHIRRIREAEVIKKEWDSGQRIAIHCEHCKGDFSISKETSLALLLRCLCPMPNCGKPLVALTPELEICYDAILTGELDKARMIDSRADALITLTKALAP